MDKLISVVVPMYFEEKVAQECYRRLTEVMEKVNYNYELVFINDGSTDNTLPILRGIAEEDERVKVIDFSRNFGHQVAVTAGVDNALGDAIVIIDADLQDPPELIPEMIKLWENGYDVVYAKRKKRKGESAFKLATAKYFYKFLDYMSDIRIPKDTGDFRLIGRNVADAFKAMPEKNRFIRGMIAWAGYKQIPIEYERDKRFAGETKYPLKKMIKLAADGIISFSSKPIKVVMYLGFFSIFICFAVFLYSIISKLVGGNVARGWTSIMVTLTFLGGIQLLSLGMIGQYIARIYDESKKRPLYLIREKVNFSELKGK